MATLPTGHRLAIASRLGSRRGSAVKGVRGGLEALLGSFVAEPIRIFSLLRLPLIGLIASLVAMDDTGHWLGTVFEAVLVLYAAVAVSWLYLVAKSPVPSWFGWASTATDIGFVVALCVASGAATVPLMPIFFLLGVSVVFLGGPAMTAGVGIASAAMYLFSWSIYAARDDAVDMPAIAYLQAGCLVWLAVALTALSHCLQRRSRHIETLLTVRRDLISQSMQMEDRRGRALSAHLHDGPLQNLLAIRLDLWELQTNPTEEGFDRLDSAVLASIADLRLAVSDLSPQLLAQLGLSAAIRELVTDLDKHSRTTLDADIEEVGQPDCQSIVFRAARELLTNVEQHAGADYARITLQRHRDTIRLRIADNGIGFTPDALPRCAAEGRIGLGSLQVAAEAMGGSMTVESAAGTGTTVTLDLPSGSATRSQPHRHERSRANV